MMKKIIVCIILCYVSFQFANGQNRNSIWIFGDSCGIDFSNINNPVPITSNMDGRGSCASIADSNGNLICYASVLGYLNSDWATRIFNAQHQILQGANHITGEGWYNEVVIIPKPNDSNKYYIFSVGLDKPNNQGCFYTLIDMSLNNGNGAVLQQNIKINNATSGDCLTAVQHGNGRDWWVINKYSSKTSPNQYNRFFVYLVTPDTVMPPIIDDFNDATDADFQKLIWNKSGSKFMLINVGGYMAEFNFDRCTGNITLFNAIYSEQSNNWNRLFWEGAYSPNDSLFYVSTVWWQNYTTQYLLQFNLAAANIAATSDTLDSFQTNMESGSVRLAPDGKIYFTRAYIWGFPGYPYPDSVHNYINENLSVINNPNALGAACNYTPFSFYLGGKRTYYGLPNNPNYSLGRLVGSACDTLQWVGTPETPNPLQGGLIQIAPNPVSKNLFFNAKNIKGKNTLIQIRNALGEIVFYKNVAVINGGYITQTIDVSLFCNGIYFISLLMENETTSMRFIKE